MNYPAVAELAAPFAKVVLVFPIARNTGLHTPDAGCLIVRFGDWDNADAHLLRRGGGSGLQCPGLQLQQLDLCVGFHLAQPGHHGPLRLPGEGSGHEQKGQQNQHEESCALSHAKASFRCTFRTKYIIEESIRTVNHHGFVLHIGKPGRLTEAARAHRLERRT